MNIMFQKLIGGVISGTIALIGVIIGRHFDNGILPLVFPILGAFIGGYFGSSEKIVHLIRKKIVKKKIPVIRRVYVSRKTSPTKSNHNKLNSSLNASLLSTTELPLPPSPSITQKYQDYKRKFKKLSQDAKLIKQQLELPVRQRRKTTSTKTWYHGKKHWIQQLKNNGKHYFHVGGKIVDLSWDFPKNPCDNCKVTNDKRQKWGKVMYVCRGHSIIHEEDEEY